MSPEITIMARLASTCVNGELSDYNSTVKIRKFINVLGFYTTNKNKSREDEQGIHAHILACLEIKNVHKSDLHILSRQSS